MTQQILQIKDITKLPFETEILNTTFNKKEVVKKVAAVPLTATAV